MCGHQGYGATSALHASVYAVDAFGASSRATAEVVVGAYEGGLEDLETRVDDLVTQALEAGDTDTVMQVPCYTIRIAYWDERTYSLCISKPAAHLIPSVRVEYFRIASITF